MNHLWKLAFEVEMARARLAFDHGEWDACFRTLERAHILGQRSTRRHVAVHYWMLKVGRKRADRREIAGQIRRIVAAALFSRIWVPVGNTGGADVPAMKPMPIPDDLRRILGR